MDQVDVKEKKLSSQFQNRLVGVIVLVALGVIFLPDILDGKKQHQEEQFAEIPLRPEMANDTHAVQALEPIDLATQQAQFEQQESSADSESGQEPDGVALQAPVTDKVDTETTAVAVKAAPVEDKATTSSAYTLQLGSFKNATNVNALVKRLRDKGYRAYTSPVRPVDGQLTKVYVGPDVSKAKLQQLQQQIDKLTGLKSAVVAYNPIR